jgi:hypothetical protein
MMNGADGDDLPALLDSYCSGGVAFEHKKAGKTAGLLILHLFFYLLMSRLTSCSGPT